MIKINLIRTIKGKEETHIISNYNGSNILDLKLIDIIKNGNPQPITEIAKIMDEDIGIIQRKINNLKEEGFIEIKENNINSMSIPIFKYDHILITID